MGAVFDIFYTVEQLGWLLQFGQPWIRERVRQGDWPGTVKFADGDLRIPGSTVAAWLDRRGFFTGVDVHPRSVVIESHLTVSIAGYLIQRSGVWVRRLVQEREFGPWVVKIGEDIRIPVSGLNAFLARHRYERTEAVAARNVAELRRKIGKAAAVEHEEAAA